MLDERIVRDVIREMVLDIKLDSSERDFHLTSSDSIFSITYESASLWYHEIQKEDNEIIQKRY